MFISRMDLYDLTINQLKRAAAIKERIEALNDELGRIFGAAAKPGTAPKKRRRKRLSGRKRAAAKKKKVFSAATRAKLSAKLKAYWAAKRAGKK